MYKLFRNLFFLAVFALAVFLTACEDAVSFSPSVTPINTQSPSLVSSPTPELTDIPLDIGSTWVSPVDGMVMVYVPEGEFLMGMEDPFELSRSHGFDLRPPEIVYLDAYWIDRTEVTNGMYKQCIESDFCEPPIEYIFTTRTEYIEDPAYDNYPALGVTWENANSYCKWAGRTLANEAQWEKAARGWDGRQYPWGNTKPACNLANYTGCYRDTLPVGSLPAGASPYGALDMAGNVWEWVADWYPAEAYPTPFPLDGQAPSLDALHVIRGGSWANDTLVLESAIRFIGWPIDEISVGFGFRCALNASDKLFSKMEPSNPLEATSTSEIVPTQRTFGPGNHYATISSGDYDRFFIIHIPPEYQSGVAIPVVFNFHGRTSNAFDQQRYAGFDFAADKYNFIVVYPQAMGAPTTWEDLPIESEVDDVRFIHELILYLEKNLNIDSQRIYATGISNGGGMVNRLACDLADKFAAVASVAGAYYYWDICEPSRPIPVLAFHGKKDNIIPFEGTQSDEFVELPNILEWAAAWAERNGCSREAVQSSDAGIINRDAWENCIDGADVILYSLTLEGHHWPLGVFEETKSANDIIWEFFLAHPMPK